MRRIIGITGNIACGKTSVGKMLLELGAERYIDADALVHQLYEPGKPVVAQIVSAFGSQVHAADGGINRKALGTLVFRDPQALQRLEQIVHPAVGQALLAEIAQTSANALIVIDAIKLLEGGSGALCQSRWLVVCTEQEELARLMTRNHLSQEEAKMRLQAQPDVKKKLALVDEVIDNSGSLEETRRQVIAAFERFCQKNPL